MNINIKNAHYDIINFRESNFGSSNAQFSVYCRDLKQGNIIKVKSEYWTDIYLYRANNTYKQIQAGKTYELDSDYLYVKFYSTTVPSERKSVVIKVAGEGTTADETAVSCSIANATDYYQLESTIPQGAYVVGIKIDSGDTIYLANTSAGAGLVGLTKSRSRTYPYVADAAKPYVRVTGGTYPLTVTLTFWVYQ